MPLRRTTVHELEVLDYDGRIAQLRTHLSSGGYVRSLAEALGGHCVALRRMTVGPFKIEDADEQRVIPPEEALAEL